MNEPNERNSGEDMTPEEALRFDPFEAFAQEGDAGTKGTSDDEGAGQQTGEEEGGGETPGGEQPPEEPAAATGREATQPPPPNDEVAQLRRHIANLESRLSQNLAPQQPQMPQQAPQGQQGRSAQPARDEGPSEQELLARYNFQLPPQLMEAIRSDEPGVANQAMTQLVAGIGASVHRNVEQRAQELIQRALTQYVPHLINQTVGQRETARSVNEDFYGKYKDLNHPELRGVVVSTAAQVARELGINSWNAQLRDETAKRVYALLNREMPGTTPAPNPNPQPTATAKPGRKPAMTGPARSRPQAAPAGDNSPEAVSDTLFGR